MWNNFLLIRWSRVRISPNPPNQSTLSQADLIVSFRLNLGSLIMRADNQRKPLGFQEVTASRYRCVVFCVVK